MVINVEWDKPHISPLPINLTFDSNKTPTAICDYCSKDAEIKKETLEHLIQMYSDRYFFHTTHKAIKSQIQNSATAPIYPYYFDYVGDNRVLHLSSHLKNL